MTHLVSPRSSAATAQVLTQRRSNHQTPLDLPGRDGHAAVATVTHLVSPRITAATAQRVLAQLRGDPRTVALLMLVPGLLLVLMHQMFNSRPDFDRIALLLLGIFPFGMMFFVTSVAMLRERTSGTLERLLTTPMSKLDLLLGYGIAFGLAAVAQATITCAIAYWLLGMATPGSPWLVVGISTISAVLGMALGLLVSAFATSEFQAAQFVPVLLYPQMLLGGLFVPREQMTGWLQAVSHALPLTYDIEALKEVGRTSVVTGILLRDTAIMIGSVVLVLALASSTLRRRAGPLPRSTRLALLGVPLVTLIVGVALTAGYLVDASRYVGTDNAQIDGDQISVTAPVGGTLIGWRATLGSTLRKNQPIGRVQIRGGFVQPQQVIRAPADGTVALNNGIEGAVITAGTQLAIAYDLSEIYVTARVAETAIGDVRRGQRVDITVDAYPESTLTGYVWQIQGSSAGLLSPVPQNNTAANFQRFTQVIPVKIAIAGHPTLTLVPGMNVTVKIHKN